MKKASPSFNSIPLILMISLAFLCSVACQETNYQSRCGDTCKTCQEGANICKICIDKHGLVPNKVCTACLDANCKLCDGDLSQCQGCSDGYYLQRTENNESQCFPCRDGCNSCSGEGYCTKCKFLFSSE